MAKDISFVYKCFQEVMLHKVFVNSDFNLQFVDLGGSVLLVSPTSFCTIPKNDLYLDVNKFQPLRNISVDVLLDTADLEYYKQSELYYKVGKIKQQIFKARSGSMFVVNTELLKPVEGVCFELYAKADNSIGRIKIQGDFVMGVMPVCNRHILEFLKDD